MNHIDKTLWIHRGAVRITGPDAAHFLQGMITNDIHELQNNSVLYTLILNQNGKFLWDCFIWRIDNDYILECAPGNIAEQIIAHFTKYRLRAKVTFNATQIEVGVTFDDPSVSYANNPGTIMNRDARDPEMSWRVLVHTPFSDLSTDPSTSVKPQIITDHAQISADSALTFRDYTMRRIERHIPDGILDAVHGVSTPEELNLTHLNAISFTKGCYLGQELTARIEHRGLAKRHLYTVHLLDNPAPLDTVNGSAPGQPILWGEKSVGDLRSHVNHLGLALLRDDIVNEIQQKTGRSDLILAPSDNGWSIVMDMDQYPRE